MGGRRQKALRVLHKPAGYNAWKDTVSIRTANYKAIGIIFGIVFVLGVLVASIVPLFFRSQEPAIVIAKAETTAEITAEATSPIQDYFSQPSIEATFLQMRLNYDATAHANQTQIANAFVSPANELLATFEAIQTQNAQLLEAQANITPSPIVPTLDIQATYNAIATAYAQPSPTPAPSYSGVAVVIVDAAIVRVAPTVNHPTLGTIYAGARYPVIETRGQWVRISYLDFETAWVAGWLVRIE